MSPRSCDHGPDCQCDTRIRARRSRRPPRINRNTARKRRMDVSGLATQHDYVTMKRLVLQRPLQGGPGSRGPCERCGSRLAADAHHRLLTAQGGPDLPSNLAALCRECHEWCHENPAQARGQGWIVPSGGNPHNRAVMLWDGRLVTLNDEYGYGFAASFPDG